MGTVSRDRGSGLPNSAAQRARITGIVERGAVGVLRHCLTVGIEIRGEADEELLRDRLARIVARRPALRAVFGDEDTHRIGDVGRATVVVRRQRVEAPSAEARWGLATVLADFEAGRPFALGQAPLVRGTLLTAEDDRHLFVVNFDQLACDAWSANLVVDELLAPDPESGPGADTDGYETVWQAREAWLASDEGHALLRKRREAVAGAWRRWPLAVEGDPADPHEVVERFVPLDEPLAASLRKQTQTARGSLLALGATALAAGVAEPVDAPLALRSTLAGREAPEEQGVVGWFANEAVLPLPPRTGTVLDYATGLRGTVFEALGAQRIPYELVDESLAEGADTGASCALVFLPKGLSGGGQAGHRLGTAVATRTAVSVCPTGADIDFFLIEEGPPIGDAPRATLTVGARTRRGVATPEDVDRLLERWTGTLATLGERDWATTPIGALGQR